MVLPVVAPGSDLHRQHRAHHALIDARSAAFHSMRTARAKGMPGWQVIVKHALKPVAAAGRLLPRPGVRGHDHRFGGGRSLFLDGRHRTMVREQRAQPRLFDDPGDYHSARCSHDRPPTSWSTSSCMDRPEDPVPGAPWPLKLAPTLVAARPGRVPRDPSEGRSLWQDAGRRFFRNRRGDVLPGPARASSPFTIVGPFFAPWSHREGRLGHPGQGAAPKAAPSSRTGTSSASTRRGATLSCRVIQGTQISLMVGVLGSAVAVVVGHALRRRSPAISAAGSTAP